MWTLKALTAVAAAGCLALVWSCARQLGRDPLPAVLLVGLNPIWLVEGVGGAHNDVFMTLAVLAAVRLALAAREASAAAAVVAAAAIKGTAGLLLPFLLMGARGGEGGRSPGRPRPAPVWPGWRCSPSARTRTTT